MDSYVPNGFTRANVVLCDLGRAIDHAGDLVTQGEVSDGDLRRLKMLHNRLLDVLLDARDANRGA